jgi:guanine deaminase
LEGLSSLDVSKYMKIAIREARIGMRYSHGGPFGAVVVKDGKIISRSHNEVLKNNDSTDHAEMLAIQEASRKLGRYDLSDCYLVTTSQPCPMCHGAANWAKIPYVYYGTSARNLKEIGFNEKKGNNKVDMKLIQKEWDKCKRLLEDYKGEVY